MDHFFFFVLFSGGKLENYCFCFRYTRIQALVAKVLLGVCIFRPICFIFGQKLLEGIRGPASPRNNDNKTQKPVLSRKTSGL